MALGEIFLSAFLQVLLDRLAPREILNYFGRLQGVGKKLEEWRDTLSAIGAVLYDAEEKQLTSKAVELWLNDLKDLVYDVEDILDMFSTEMLRRMAKERNGDGISKVRGLFPKVKFHFNMNSNIEEINARLRRISERKDKLGLVVIEAMPTTIYSHRMPSSYVLDGPVVGRDEERRKIVRMLSNVDPRTDNFHVVAIVGLPGLGKTTLAGHVFDDVAMEQFNPKVWVSVSDDFNIVRVTKAILESITSQHSALQEFSKLQDNLIKELTGKKFLIVLDDVWSTCDYVQWTKLQSPFRVGAPGSKIIVTTRDSKVARMMGANEVHNLETLSHDDCLKVFEQHALFTFNSDKDKPPNFELLQEKIVAKCGGLPLVARTLGGLLRCKDIDAWEEILNDKLWSLSNESGILPVLKLSYHYLPSNLKRCFAYCSILPNDFEFGKKQLIHLWMAEGLLQQSEKGKHMEDIGGEYFGELLSRSLFQKSANNSTYVMHDLVSDLARWAAGETCFRLEDRLDGKCSSKARHSSYISGRFDGIEKFGAFSKSKNLRTFLPLTLSYGEGNYLTSLVTTDLLPNLPYLRVLSLSGYRISKLPDSIGELKHVRYLDFSHTLIVSLPESISTLYNLQTLLLESCSKLKALPANMRKLTKLRHLDNSNVPLLGSMPSQLSRLTNLQTLANFVVEKGRVSGISEIGPLLLLRGTLQLSRLENVISAEDARQTNLTRKDKLDGLKLEWSGTGENEADVLNMLKPHRKLKELAIKGYCGLQFSTWIGDPVFSNMVLVRLENCDNCQFLPPLGQLLSLKELFVGGMSRVECVGLEFYGKGDISFPLLETLEFEDMQQWKEWCPCGGDGGIRVFPCLKKLSIKRCPKVEGRLPENIDSLTELRVHGCHQLALSIGNYKQVCQLDIKGCKVLLHDKGAVNFESLEVVCLSTVSELRLRMKMEGFMSRLKKVKSLEIVGCEELISAWKNEDNLLQHLISLRQLCIVGSSVQIVQLHRLVSLQELHIYRCPNLVSFAEDGLPLNLKEVTIRSCDSLSYFSKYQILSCLRRIEIRECKQLKLLVEEDASSSSHSNQEASCLEYLEICDCPSLTSLSFRGQLPKALKRLCVSNCIQLESISDNRLQENSCLEHIYLHNCENLKSLPDGLSNLTNLEWLMVQNCGSLVSFPSEGLPTTASNFTYIGISLCPKLEALPKGLDKHNLNSLQTLTIGCCEGLASILEEGFPPNLTSLNIVGSKRCKPLSEWGLHLHRLTSLKQLWLNGVDDHLASFPPEAEGGEILLPKSLVKLEIQGFPKLRRFCSKGFQSLTSLEYLEIYDCPKLKSIPDGLPLSVTQLYIYNDCPLLRKRYKPVNARHWATIAHIPFVYIGDYDSRPRIPQRELIFKL